MKTPLALSILVLMPLSLQAGMSSIKVIYGEDDRKDVYAVTDSMQLTLAKSTAGMIDNKELKESDGYQTVIKGKTLAERGICEEERFAKQPTAANCSGFLVAPDVLVTAGHCVTSQRSCEQYSWVFDYKVDYETQSEVTVDNTSIYKCKEIIAQELNNTTQMDYAVIRLDRKVEDREPLKLNTSSTVDSGAELVVIGHPTGLPTKISGGAVVSEVNEIYFNSNLDTFGGNSGSAVFNALTGEVEGILVRGITDYVYDRERYCRLANRVENDHGDGESSTLIKHVLKHLELDQEEPVRRGLVSRLFDWMRNMLRLNKMMQAQKVAHL